MRISALLFKNVARALLSATLAHASLHAEDQAGSAGAETGAFSTAESSQESGPPTGQDPNYRLRDGDMVQIFVFNEPELATAARLDQSGKIECPLIGEVTLRLLTVKEAARRIETAYRESYLVKPQVSLVVSEYSKQVVTVLGQVGRPGTYDLPANRDLTLLQLLGMAGGTTRIAKLSRVKVARKKPGGGEEMLVVNVSHMIDGKLTEPFKLRDGDVVTVTESWF